MMTDEQDHELWERLRVELADLLGIHADEAEGYLPDDLETNDLDPADDAAVAHHCRVILARAIDQHRLLTVAPATFGPSLYLPEHRRVMRAAA